jgi:hypothetical protein
MYTIRVGSMILFFLSGTLSLAAQDQKREEDVLKEIQEQEILNRKKMLEEQQEQMRQFQLQYADQAKDLEQRAREDARDREVIRSTRVFPEGYYFVGSNRGSQSQITLRKHFDGTTSTSKGSFDVDSEVRQFRCMINGSVQSGEIMITIGYPDGKVFKELVINASADINFSQSISIKEGEEKKYVGSWDYIIKTDKADGDYMIQISTN